MTLKQKLYTVYVFFITSIKRLFRDRMALFFTFMFPLIFLFVFGALNRNNSVSFSTAVINESGSAYSKEFLGQLEKQKALKINKDIHTFSEANEKMARGELDATIELPGPELSFRPSSGPLHAK
jgi:ABC-2 type transport system permease protein